MIFLFRFHFFPLNRNTMEFLGVWKRIYNPNFNCTEFAQTTKSYISKIENGVITPSVGVFYRIIAALGMRVEVVKPI